MSEVFIQKNLLAWFEEEKRPLPWREKYEPYHVWISEIMLQQTQVKTVLPYYKRWLAKLPTVQSVAEAKEDTVLKLWEGLGYYSRVRNLQKAAKVIVGKWNGEFPDSYSDILSLPGVGKYTAGAIASIAFNQGFPVVDGNVIRVMSRLRNFGGNTRLPVNVKKMWEWADELLPQGQARNFNQGMMELGALICSPKKPRCEACPLQTTCLSFKKGNQEDLPDRGEKIKTESIQVAIAVIRKGDRVFIQKRSAKGLMGGLWEFPGGKIEKGETVEQGLKREIKEELGVSLKKIRPITRIKHAYTRFKVDLHCFYGEVDDKLDGKWVKKSNLKKYPFPAANVRLIDKI